MKITNKKFNQDLKPDFNNVSSKIDYRNYTKETRKVSPKFIRRVTLSSVCVVLICFICVGFASTMNVNESINMKKKSYSLNEVKQIQGGTFKALNNVTYPELSETKQEYKVSEDYVSAMRNFAYNVNQQMNLEDQNVIYSPLSLYSFLDVSSILSDNTEVNNQFDEVLGLTKEVRRSNYDNMFKNNFYVTNSGTTQMYNGLFVSNSNTFNQNIIDQLTKEYVETYQLDFNNDKDVSYMLKWIDQKVDSKSFLSKQDLNITLDTMMYLYSTLYYKNTWRKQYSPKKTYEGTFYGSKEETSVKFMNHVYFGEVYDYGDYYTFRDDYNNDYTIKYIVPKELSTSVYDVVKDTNIFEDDEEKRVYPTKEDYGNKIIVDLSVPKFSVTYLEDFTSSLKQIGLTNAFDRNIGAFNSAFTDLDSSTNVYLEYVKQKNVIEFDEDGTIAKTVTFGQYCGDSAPIELDTLTVKLNQPFIYIIEDSNGLPLYLGTVNNL